LQRRGEEKRKVLEGGGKVPGATRREALSLREIYTWTSMHLDGFGENYAKVEKQGPGCLSDVLYPVGSVFPIA